MAETPDGDSTGKGSHWITEFIARDGKPFNYAGFYERILDMSENGEMPITVPHACCDPVRDPVREINEAFEAQDGERLKRIQARISFAICMIDDIKR